MQAGTTKENSLPLFVIAATIASTLRPVVAIAREITLAAKNAMAISARASEQAFGFKPITAFIEEMGRDTESLVRQVTDTALTISQAAVAEMQSSDAYARFRKAAELASHARHSESIAPVVQQIGEVHEVHLLQLRRAARSLDALLEEIRTKMRAAHAIAMRARVEARRVDEYQDSLVTVTDSVESAAHRINDIAKQCQQMLETGLASRFIADEKG